MAETPRPPLPHDHLPPVPSLTVESDDIAHEQRCPDPHLADQMGMTGDNVSPHLRWSGAPSSATTCSPGS